LSDIDQYIHTCLGLIECPRPSGLINYAIYHLEQDIPESETSFQGRSGDIILGGGMGEFGAMLISIPEALILHTDFEVIPEDMELYENAFSAIYHTPEPVPVWAYWTPTESYKFGVGYARIGWDFEEAALEKWIAYHILGFSLKYHATRFKFPDPFRIKEGTLKPLRDGSICRLLTDEEDRMYNRRKYRT